MANAPQDDRRDGDDSNEPLYAGEPVLDGPNGDDDGASPGMESGEQECPDQENRQNANWN